MNILSCGVYNFRIPLSPLLHPSFIISSLLLSFITLLKPYLPVIPPNFIAPFPLLHIFRRHSHFQRPFSLYPHFLYPIPLPHVQRCFSVFQRPFSCFPISFSLLVVLPLGLILKSVSPSQVIFLMSIYYFVPAYWGDYTYPNNIQTLGWFICVCSIAFIPLGAIYTVWKGDKRGMDLVKASPDFCPYHVRQMRESKGAATKGHPEGIFRYTYDNEGYQEGAAKVSFWFWYLRCFLQLYGSFSSYFLFITYFQLVLCLFSTDLH